MPQLTLVVSLPIADRRSSCAFYQDVLGLPPTGAPADDGVPEPLQFVLHDGARLMLVPRGGFGWVIGDHRVAPPGNSECVLSLSAGTQAGVNETTSRALSRPAATWLPSPGSGRGATAGRSPTPMATSGW
jgi:hypothetical protein